MRAEANGDGRTYGGQGGEEANRASEAAGVDADEVGPGGGSGGRLQSSLVM